MSYKKNITNTLVTRLIGISISFITSIVLARGLGAQNRGYLQYLILIISIFSQFGHLSIIDATTYFQKKSIYNESEIYNTNKLILSILWFIELIIVFGIRKMGLFLTEYTETEILLSFLTVLITFQVSLIIAINIGNNKIKYINNITLIGLYTKFSLLLLCFYMKKLTVKYFLIIVLIQGILQLLLFSKKFFSTIKLNVNLQLIINEIKFGFFVYLASLFIFLNYRIDQFMIKGLLSVANLGVYVIAVTIAELIFTIPKSVISSYRGAMYNIDNSDTVAKKSLTAKTVKYTFWLSFIIAVFVYCFSFTIPYIYGMEYREAIAAIKLLLPGVVVGTIGKVTSNYYVIEGRPRMHMWVSLGVLIINIIFNFILVVPLGINGAALASTISYIAYGSIYMVLLSYKEKIDIRNIIYISPNDIKTMIQEIKLEHSSKEV